MSISKCNERTIIYKLKTISCASVKLYQRFKCDGKLLELTFFVTMNICGFEIKCILNINQTQNNRNIIKQTKSKLFFKNIRNDLLQKVSSWCLSTLDL